MEIMDWMKDDGIFMPMLNDTGRNQFYKRALEQFAPGQTVCDIGAGTGLLSVLAVQAGARHVFAVERDKNRCAYLQNIVARLNLANQIEVVHGDFLQTNIAADVYVSETINTQIFGEDMARLSNHALAHKGKFIPSGVRIWAEVYENHPVFILDLGKSEAYEFDPNIEIDKNFTSMINSDFENQYNLQQTVYAANYLNRLFTMLPNFTDLKLNKLGSIDPITVDFNQPIDESNIQITVPFDIILQDQARPNRYDHAMIVLKWQMFAGNVVLDSGNCWFGNVAKAIQLKFRTSDQITFTYNPDIRDWRLKY